MNREKAIAALAALAHETRLDVFRLLVRRGGEGMAPSAIADQLRLAPATLSFHLKELKIAGVVRCERRGRSLLYSPDFTAMTGLLEFLTANCCESVSACTPSRSKRSA